MKTVPLTIRRCPPAVHRALKKSAEVNHRSLNGEALEWLEREAEDAKSLTCGELARNLRRAQKLLTPRERKEFARAIAQARNAMSHEHLY
jgi:hypothetical protein